MLSGIGEAELITLGARWRRVERNPVALEPIQEFGQCDPRRIDGRPRLDLSDQPSAFDLCLAFRPPERMPTALAPGLRIARVNDDGPMTGRPLADVAFHFFSS